MPPSFRIAALLAFLPVAGVAQPGVPRPAHSPLEFASLLAQYDGAADGPARDALAARVDAAGHQRYATVSRLYWHTDLATAKAAAREQQRPILHLRMLGRLDEDLSCANSRFFRATLYANSEVSRLLRDKFVLYWSTERAVPKVTIDFGDGRKLVQTTTGNSAHYVMDADGHVLDVLPGLYAPIAFRQELEGSLALAAKVRGANDAARATAVAAYHQAEVAGVGVAWRATAAQRISMEELSMLGRAQEVTITKSRVELPQLRSYTANLPPELLAPERVDLWAATGRSLYGFDKPTAPPMLDEQSLALVIRLHDAVPGANAHVSPATRETVVSRLERHIIADTALSQLRLRAQISREIARQRGAVDFTSLNGWVYANVFHTPAADPWLGLLPRTDVTGLPGDGVVMP